jgi:hypothetical protein
MGSDPRSAAVQAILRHFTDPDRDDFEHPDAEGVPLHSFSSDPDDQPPAIVSAAVRILKHLDRAGLEREIGKPLSDEAVTELVCLAAIYSQRFRVTDREMLDERIWPQLGYLWNVDRSVQDVRRAFVRAAEDVWSRNGGDRHNLTWNPKTETHDGPLVVFLQELLRAAGVTSADHSAASLRHDLGFIYTGRERPRGR